MQGTRGKRYSLYYLHLCWGEFQASAYLAEGRGRGRELCWENLQADQDQTESLVRLVSRQGPGKHLGLSFSAHRGC